MYSGDREGRTYRSCLQNPNLPRLLHDEDAPTTVRRSTWFNRGRQGTRHRLDGQLAPLELEWGDRSHDGNAANLPAAQAVGS